MVKLDDIKYCQAPGPFLVHSWFLVVIFVIYQAGVSPLPSRASLTAPGDWAFSHRVAYLCTGAIINSSVPFPYSYFLNMTFLPSVVTSSRCLSLTPPALCSWWPRGGPSHPCRASTSAQTTSSQSGEI